MINLTKLLFATSTFALATNALALEIKDVQKLCAGVNVSKDDVRKGYLDYIYKTYSVPFDFIYSQGDLRGLLTYCITPSDTDADHCKIIMTMHTEVSDLLEDGFVGPRNSLKVNKSVDDPGIDEAVSFLSRNSNEYKLYCSET